MKHSFKKLTLFLALFLNSKISANRIVQYKAPYFKGETRLVKDKLNTLEFSIAGGNSTNGFNTKGKKVNILNIYGPENFREIANGVSATILDKNPGAIIDTLWSTSLSGFGLVNLSGKFSIVEANIDYTKNFNHGLFTQVNIPIRKVKLKDFSYTDTSPSTLAGTASYTDWKNFVGNLVGNMEKYGIYLQNHNDTSIGDIELSVGWTQTNTDTKYLDFWDTTIKAGIIIPTAPCVCPEYPLMISSGYNKNVGFPFSFCAEVGLYEWLTLGTFLEGILFIDKLQTVSMKTAPLQNGFIKMSKGLANVEKGNMWEIGSFIKSDHLPWGLSLLFAYSYTAQKKTNLNLPLNSSFNCAIVNKDLTLYGWDRHTIHTSIEYDFATSEERIHLPRIKASLDIPFAGRHIFGTKMLSSSIGIEFVW